MRLAALGYFGHMWELYAMWAWFLVFFVATGASSGSGAAYATFAVIGVGAIGCYVGGVVGDRIGHAESAALMLAVLRHAGAHDRAALLCAEVARPDRRACVGLHGGG